MPGKQMSIDANLRVGAIDNDTAKSKHDELGRENQLYGVLDGAMKFLKGDAVASLIITVINIVAGLILGVTQKGMDVQKALKTYPILTIGDGLISQIPALLIAMTSGVIVTRVAYDTSGALGQDIAKQIFAQPKALLIASVMVLLMMMIPGFPKIPFVILGVALFFGGKDCQSQHGHQLLLSAEQVRDYRPTFSKGITG